MVLLAQGCAYIQEEGSPSEIEIVSLMKTKNK